MSERKLAPEITRLRHGGRTNDGGKVLPELRFLTPGELREMTPPEPPWLWHGYIARGAVTLFAGKPKVGKTTLKMGVCGAIGTNAPSFLGRAISGGPVLYVSEEGAPTLVHKLPEGDFRILTRDLAWPRPAWERLIESAIAEANRVEAVLLVIDTFSFWGALPAEREKDAGATQAAMEPLIAGTRENLAILLGHHQRKGGGDEGEGVRGSSALAGAADIVLELERPEKDRQGKRDPRQRQLLGLSRYPQTPGALVIDHDPTSGGWRAIGEGTERGEGRKIANRAIVLAVLERGDELKRKELEEATALDWRQLSEALKDLEEEGTIDRSGKGVRGDPHRFRKVLSTVSVRDAGQKGTERGGADVSVSVRPYRGDRNKTNETDSVHDSCPPPSAETLEDWVLADPDGIARAVNGGWEV
jgi:hypothetical protein